MASVTIPSRPATQRARKQTMKAAVAREFGKPLSIEQVTVPEVVPGRILVKIAASGVCHTDLHAVDGDWPVKPIQPLIPGHDDINTIFDRMHAGTIDGRVVMTI